VQIERRLIGSLLAHAFLSTFPRRTNKTHPTLQDFNFWPFFNQLHRRAQQAKLRSILHYFQRMGETPAEGHVTFSRQVMSGREWCTLEQWLQCQRPLCPLVVRHEGRVETSPNNGVRVCFANRRPGSSYLSDGASQECALFSSSPELLSLLPFVETLEDNEAITAHGLHCYSIIHDLKNKAVFDPTPGPNSSSTSTTSTPSKAKTEMCLIDAEDYSDLPIRQYEEDNVLRELNKAFIGFQQAVAATQQRLPPVGASRGSSPTPCDTQPPRHDPCDQERNDWTRSQTLVASSCSDVASSCDGGSRRPSGVRNAPPPDADPPSEEPTPTLLYGGGRNAPLTLVKATLLKSLEVAERDDGGDGSTQKMALSSARTRAPSLYASCYSDDQSSADEFRSANTSFDEQDRLLSCSLPKTAGNRWNSSLQDRSSESDSSCGKRRAGSRGFALEGSGEEDSFSGDGLEKEQKWLEHFRERRGRSRSGARDKDSSRDSSRYSFSTEFSSELDELYDQFSYWLDDPDCSGQNSEARNERNVAVFRFAHSLLKRALSDSFASVAMNIDNLNKCNPSPERKSRQQRSWSLVDHLDDERLALQLAKEMVERTESGPLPLPPPPPPPPPSEGSRTKLAAQLVSIILHQTLADVELELQVPQLVPTGPAQATDPAGRQPINRHLDLDKLRSQDSVAWEYQQNPSCTLTVPLAAEKGTARLSTSFLRRQMSLTYAHHHLRRLPPSIASCLSLRSCGQVRPCSMALFLVSMDGLLHVDF